MLADTNCPSPQPAPLSAAYNNGSNHEAGFLSYRRLRAYSLSLRLAVFFLSDLLPNHPEQLPMRAGNQPQKLHHGRPRVRPVLAISANWTRPDVPTPIAMSAWDGQLRNDASHCVLVIASPQTPHLYTKSSPAASCRAHVPLHSLLFNLHTTLIPNPVAVTSLVICSSRGYHGTLNDQAVDRTRPGWFRFTQVEREGACPISW